MAYDVAIVGGGIAGLTAAAYIGKAGRSVLLIEKEEQVGGLTSSFRYKDFVFDGGIRAIESSGIVMPMLRQLDIPVDFVRSPVTIGIGDDFVQVDTRNSLSDYRDMLVRQFPDNQTDIDRIISEIRRIMQYLEVLYGIDNPIFLDMTRDREYLIKTILPWMLKYPLTIGKIQKLSTPVVEYLKKFTANQSLIDMIAQHFFQETPVFFALSYFSLYLDYQYPLGGTGTLSASLERFILAHGGKIALDSQIVTVHPLSKILIDRQGRTYSYRKLIWAADMKALYASIAYGDLGQHPALEKIQKKKAEIADKKGSDSVLTIYLTVNMDPSRFASVCSAHCFYTPDKKGLSTLDPALIRKSGSSDDESYGSRDEIAAWIRSYLQLTTYEISVPALRDESLAPAGKTGMIISTLFDYTLTRHIKETGWYEDFKDIAAEEIISVFNNSMLKGFQDQIMDFFVATPLTLADRTGNSEGAITGWAFTNSTMPAEHRMIKIARSVLTPIPDTYQAGQWTYSPSGLPISVLTGKMAADRALRDLKKQN